MKHAASIESVISKIATLRNDDTPVLVAIDGRGGAGKSTIARLLARSLDASIVPGDDFYRVMDDAERLAFDPKDGYERFFDWERLRSEVLEPLRSGTDAEYQSFDWNNGRLLQQRVAVPAKGIVIVEGVYSFRPELRSLYDLSVLIHTPRSECAERMIARGENDALWINKWMASEDWYFANELSEQDVDTVISGSRTPNVND